MAPDYQFTEDDDQEIFSFAYILQAAAELIDHLFIFIQQVVLAFLKNSRQKWVNGRNSIKTTVLIPIGVLGFTALVCVIILTQIYPEADYSLRSLPPLSKSGK